MNMAVEYLSEKSDFVLEKKITILVICASPTVYAVQLIHEMKKRYLELFFSLFTSTESLPFYESRLDKAEIDRIYSYRIKGKIRHFKLIGILRSLPHFDIVHSLWMERDWCFHAFQIKRRCKRWFLSIGGSDLFRECKTAVDRALKIRTIKRASWISGEGESTVEFFFKTFGDKYRKVKHSVNPFGVDILDEMWDASKVEIERMKRNWGIPLNKTVVVCGYNAGAAHNHFRMIDAIANIDIVERNKMFLVFPMTYPRGRSEYIASVREKLNAVTKNYIILETFLPTKKMAEMAMVSDVMIHVQTTDQLSSTMVSHMYNGNVVIAGSWLPYGQLKDRGIRFEEVDDVGDLAHLLPEVVANLRGKKQECKQNRDLVWEMSSWDKAAKRWHDSYVGILEV